MRYTLPLTFTLAVSLFCGCTMFEAKEPPPPPVVPKQLAVPVGKDWKVVEEAPQLTNERHNRLPFQMEESVLPEGTKTPPVEEQRRLETPR